MRLRLLIAALLTAFLAACEAHYERKSCPPMTGNQSSGAAVALSDFHYLNLIVSDGETRQLMFCQRCDTGPISGEPCLIWLPLEASKLTLESCSWIWGNDPSGAALFQGKSQ